MVPWQVTRLETDPVFQHASRTALRTAPAIAVTVVERQICLNRELAWAAERSGQAAP